MNNLVKKEPVLIKNALNILEEKTGILGEFHASEFEPKKSFEHGEIDFHITGSNKVYTFRVEISPKPLHNTLYAAADALLTDKHKLNKRKGNLIFAAAISAKIKERCREMKIGYLDGGGNLYFSKDDTVIFIDGLKIPQIPTEKVPNRAFSKTGLKVVFYFLAEPENINLSYRKIAESTGASLGTIKDVMSGLLEAGYLLDIDDKRRRIIHRKELLDQWVSGYFLTLKPGLFKGYYDLKSRSQMDTALAESPNFIWTGEQGAAKFESAVIPSDFQAYTDLETIDLMQLGLQPAIDKIGKIRLFNKFWDDHLFDNSLAKYLLIYADLMITDDPRNVDTANEIYAKFLAKTFDHD